MKLEEVLDEITEFRDARDWKQFHSVRNLITALAVETGELQEAILWISDDLQVEALLASEDRSKITDEIADVLIFALLLAEAVGEDPTALIRDKIKQNAAKYPVDRAWGSSKKYTEY